MNSNSQNKPLTFQVGNPGSFRDVQGFTLLEVLISIFILVIISLSIYQLTTETFRLRDSLMNEGDFYNGIRLSMGIMERDISQLFNPLVMAPEDKTKKVKKVGQPELPPQEEPTDLVTTKYWEKPVGKIGIRPLHFLGEANKLSFIANSHLRVYKESLESDFAKVSYDMMPEKKSDYSDGTTQILVKNESPNVFVEDEDKDKFKHTYPLLRGIKTIKFEYYWKEKERWESRWDSDNGDQKDLYPDAIKVTLTVLGPSRLNFDGIYEFRPELPLRALDPSI